ncbi:MAG: hypothetical protein FWH55_00540 [Oscillospiraceae bacterium]|nr:hypothetical protein [Oscillospiraceae bacterium]
MRKDERGYIVAEDEGGNVVVEDDGGYIVVEDEGGNVVVEDEGRNVVVEDEGGYIVVETVGVFTLFVLLIASILSLVGIVSLQARVHSAITQTAQTLSMYSYIFEITGTSDQFIGTNANTAIRQAGVNELRTGISAIAGAINAITGDALGGQGQTVLDGASDLFSDPSSLISLLLNDARNTAFAELAIRPLIGRYLRNGTMSGDQYLRSMGVANGVRGLEIMGYDYDSSGSGSGTGGVLIDRDGGITIAVRYEVNYSFGGLPLPFTKLRVTQSAVTRAWLGGEGVRYRG